MSSLETIKAKLVEGRTALISMLDEKDKTKLSELHTTIKKVTGEINGLIPGLKGIVPDGGLNELNGAWVVFRDGRDNNVIPALLAGRIEEAKSIATGIQKERFQKVSSILDGLIGKK